MLFRSSHRIPVLVVSPSSTGIRWDKCNPSVFTDRSRNLNRSREKLRSSKMNMYRSIGVLLGSLVLVLILVLPRAPTPMASAGAPLAQGTLTSTTFVYLPFVAKHCPTGTAPFNPTSGALRGVFEGDLPGDSGRTRLGTFDRNSGLFHYFIKFYWNLDSGENVTN